MAHLVIDTEAIWEVLNEVKDPEMPSVSMVEMGMINRVNIESGRVRVDVLPTFVGCPALDIMKNAIAQRVSLLEGVCSVDINFVFDPLWTSERISDVGRENLKKHGIAVPPKNYEMGDPWQVTCPYCDSPYTRLDNIFGPAACRSILYCKHCKNPFEALKPQ
jgi:ring-1,2-phenylacetyl-CoA epoxidase subunit PaaD